MNKGIIYLIQPSELVGTSRYKIGCSKNPDLDRCKNGYKKGSRYICIMECIKPLILELNIKKQFNRKFKLIAGNEYYEGNEKDILNTFNNLVMEYNNDNFDYEIKEEFSVLKNESYKVGDIKKQIIIIKTEDEIIRDNLNIGFDFDEDYHIKKIVQTMDGDIYYLVPLKENL